MMPLSGMELSANKVEVQKKEQPDSAFKDRGENDYASKSMITEFRKEIRNSESENKMELKHLLSLTGTLARMMAVKTALQLYFFHTKKFCIWYRDVKWSQKRTEVVNGTLFFCQVLNQYSRQNRIQFYNAFPSPPASTPIIINLLFSI